MIISPEEIEEIVEFKLDAQSKQQIIDANLSYRHLDVAQINDYLIHVIDVLTTDIVVSGEHRINEWERGWSENLELFSDTGNIDDLIPKYHSKNRYARWKQRIINPESNNFDYKLHVILLDIILKRYLQDVDNIFEFGCGPGYHLLRLNKYFPEKTLTGMDWTIASQNIISNINKKIGTSINGRNFNFFGPNYSIDIPKNSAIYTVAALEQVGNNFKEFIKFLLVKKPAICIHFEPIDELLDKNHLIDNLSIKYFRKRKYLDGFLPYLEELEKQGKIEIIKKQRMYSGSYFIEGHSLIIWKPL